MQFLRFLGFVREERYEQIRAELLAAKEQIRELTEDKKHLQAVSSRLQDEIDTLRATQESLLAHITEGKTEGHYDLRQMVAWLTRWVTGAYSMYDPALPQVGPMGSVEAPEVAAGAQSRPIKVRAPLRDTAKARQSIEEFLRRAQSTPPPTGPIDQPQRITVTAPQ